MFSYIVRRKEQIYIPKPAVMDHLVAKASPQIVDSGSAGSSVVAKALRDDSRFVKVPCFSTHNYPYRRNDEDLACFFGYPTLQGWDALKLLQGDYQGRTRRDGLSFLQSWLFFGFLQEVLGVKIDKHDFIYEENSQRFVTTSLLPRYLREWKDRVHKDKADARNRKRFLDTILIKVNDLVSRWFVGEQEKHLSSDLDFGSDILFSVCVLGESLDWSMKMIYEDFDAEDVMMPTIVELFTIRELSPRGLTLHSRMVDDGWCPSYIMFIWKTLGASGLYACFLIGPPAKRRDHVNCPDHRCLVDQVDEKHYETVHVLPRNCCSHVIPDVEAVRDIVDGGRIPLISMFITQDDLDVKVVAYKFGTPYIAISHVWSDGLGNVSENSLPMCQLKRLRSKIRTSLIASESLGISYGPLLENDGRLYIWMDTLCVPLSPMSSRKSAIAKMKSCYSEAAIVWVLDSSIKQLSMTDDLEKTLLRMATSQWLKRLWTLQEGAFSRALIFEIMEAGLPITNLFAYWKEQEVANIHNRLPWVTSALVTSFLALPDLEAGKRFIALCEQVRWRTTSRSTDEPICLATVLGLDVKEILDAPDDQKMIKFLHLHRMFLSDVLFWKLPRLQKEGYRWAPKSFLSRPPCADFTGASLSSYGFCHKFGVGLMSTFAGFVFPAGQTQIYQRFYERSTRDQYTWWIDEVSGNEGKKIVLGAALVLRSKNPFSSPLAEIEDGVLVSVWHKEPGMLFVHYLMRVQVRKIVKGSAEDISETIPEVLREGMPDCSAEFVGNDQKWCVG